MKFKLPIGVCVLIALALVLFGLLFGTMNGFKDDRAQVMALLEDNSGLMDVLSYRGADGLNLCVVARRHLNDDADVQALNDAANKLRDSKEGVASKKLENDKLDAAVSAVSQKLKQTQSFLDSQRDQNYLDMLTTDMQNLQKSALADTYNAAATEFNQRLNAPVLGDIAKLLGVTPCELYQ